MSIVYIGEAASLSFLQLIRDTVTAQIGPSQFSQSDKRHSMLETEPSVAVDSNDLEPTTYNLDVENSLLYARIYEAAVSIASKPFFPIITMLITYEDWRTAGYFWTTRG